MSTKPPGTATRDQLRAMAHPLRIRIVSLLLQRGHARAADLAQELDLPANAISYHLQALAKGGIIVEAPELARDKRDRVWKPTPREDFTLDTHTATTEDIDATLQLVTSQLDQLKSTWAQALHPQNPSTETSSHAAKYSALLYSPITLTSDQAVELKNAVSQLIESYQQANQESPTGEMKNYDFMLSLVITGKTT